VAGRVTAMKPFFVERGAATADQPFEREHKQWLRCRE